MGATAYLWVKTFHIVFVVGWMSCVFYLPRILVNMAEAGDSAVVRERLLLMGRRLARFSQVMFGVMFLLGLLLWLGWRVMPGFPTMVAAGTGWMHAKLLLVALLFAYNVWISRMLRRAGNGAALPSSKALRWLNEIPLPLLIFIVWLVLAKPF